MSAREPFDVFVIGGGINGCGIARDAVGRGYSVCLAEMNDLASGTSSGSTKIVHGGLRYLEHFEFRLVREALSERETLLSIAPHLVRPLRIVLPHHKGLRPAWLLRLGLFLYDHMGGRRILAATQTLDLAKDDAGKPLKSAYRQAFEFSDCTVNDARLVVANARDAADRGADIRPRTKVVRAVRMGAIWEVMLEDMHTQERETVNARILVNAAGPWVDTVLDRVVGRAGARNVRLVQGSHIVVPRLYDHDRAYLFQNSDGRIVFAIPYEQDFTLIGTTDRDFDDDPSDATISDAEITYLCEAASEYFETPIVPEEVCWSYSAVRALHDDGTSSAQEVTREYILQVEGDVNNAPRVDVFGGKITTYRRLAAAVLGKIEAALGMRGRAWTKGAILPGGDFDPDQLEAQVAQLKKAFAFLDIKHAQRLFRLYGTRAHKLLRGVKSKAAMGRCFGGDLYEVEVNYLIEVEWAQTADDVLWRRTKMGLTLSSFEAEILERFIATVLTKQRPGV